MNEKIKELAKQAGWQTGMTYDDCMQCSRFDIEKFAELIVGECAEFAEQHNSDVEGVTLGVGQALKKHFGVEE